MVLSCIASCRAHIAAYRSVRFPQAATQTTPPLQRRTADERSTSVNIADLPRTAEPVDVASRVDALDWHL